MPDFQDLISLVRGPIPEKPLVAIWSIPPGSAGMVGGVPAEPGLTGLTLVFLTQMGVIRQKLPDHGLALAKCVKSMGPAERGGLLLNYENFFLGLYEDPARLKRFMAMLAEFIIKSLRLQERIIGEAEVLQLADHVPSQVPPEHLEEFALPYLRPSTRNSPRP